MITISELAKLCFPPGSPVTGDRSVLEREVTWATRPRPSPPAFGHLSGGELVLLRMDDLADVDDRLTLEGAIRQLSGFNVSAVAVAGPISEQDQRIAEERKVALVQLPANSDLGEYERRASHLIAEQRRDRQRKGHESGRKLMELAISGESLAMIISTLNQLSGQAVALEGRDGRLLTYFANPDQPERAIVEPLLDSSRSAVNNWLAVTSDASPAEPPTMHLAMGVELDRTVAPVIGRDGLLGCLSLVGPVGAWSNDDAMLASRGAAACAIVLAREFASIAARREIELNVLDEVLDGALRNEETLLQQARRLGHDLLEPHTILVAQLEGADPDSLRERIREAIAYVQANALWRIKDDAIELVLGESQQPDQMIETIRRHIPLIPIHAALGTFQPGLIGLQRSRQEARQALTIQRRLGIAPSFASFADLGVFRLLFAAESLPEFAEFHDHTLGVLIGHDAVHHSDFVATLRAFFASNCGPKEAALRMGVHRNTILYRLGRIAILTGYDLDDADVRLRLQLALSINTITGSRTTDRSAIS